MAVVASANVYASGTGYGIELRNPEFKEPDQFSVELFTGNRQGDYAIVQDGVWEMIIDGEVVGTFEGFSPMSVFLNDLGVLTGTKVPDSPETDVTVTYVNEYWGIDETFNFTAESTVTDISVQGCSTLNDDVTMAEDITVELPISNSGGKTGTVEITILFNGEEVMVDEVEMEGYSAQTVIYEIPPKEEGDIDVEYEVNEL